MYKNDLFNLGILSSKQKRGCQEAASSQDTKNNSKFLSVIPLEDLESIFVKIDTSQANLIIKVQTISLT
jgi:hypothetical protein